MKTGTLVGLALVASVALVAAGCGGSSRNKAYSASKADFAAAVNSLCVSVNARAKAAHLNSVQSIVDQGPALQAAFKKAVDKLKSLEPPAEIKAPVEDFIKKSDEQLKLLGDLISAAKANDTAKIQQLGTQGDALSKSQDPDANAIGAPACLSNA